MAEAFPKSEFVGFDFHDGSIADARRHAKAQAKAGNVRFEVSSAKTFPGRGYDLVTFFDCLHDMGDPAGAARHVHDALKPDGSWDQKGIIRIWDHGTGMLRASYDQGLSIAVTSGVAFDSGGARLAAGLYDGTTVAARSGN